MIHSRPYVSMYLYMHAHHHWGVDEGSGNVLFDIDAIKRGLASEMSSRAE